MNCRNCLKSLTAHERTTDCDSCQGKIHIACVGFSEKEFVTTRSRSKSIKFVCNACSANMSQFKDLKGLIVSIRTEFMSAIDKLREDFSEQLRCLQSPCDNNRMSPESSVDFEEVIQEFSDRKTRENNVIMFGILEDPFGVSSGESDRDTTTVDDIIKKLLPSFNGERRVARVGRRLLENNRSRPVKVTFTSRSVVSDLIRNVKKLSEYPIYAKVSLSYDRTPRQVEYFKSLKAKLMKRLEAGESNLKIRYFNGVPKITSGPNLN